MAKRPFWKNFIRARITNAAIHVWPRNRRSLESQRGNADPFSTSRTKKRMLFGNEFGFYLFVSARAKIGKVLSGMHHGHRSPVCTGSFRTSANGPTFSRSLVGTLCFRSKSNRSIEQMVSSRKRQSLPTASKRPNRSAAGFGQRILSENSVYSGRRTQRRYGSP